MAIAAVPMSMAGMFDRSVIMLIHDATVAGTAKRILKVEDGTIMPSSYEPKFLRKLLRSIDLGYFLWFLPSTH